MGVDMAVTEKVATADGLFLSAAPDPQGSGWLAVLSRGHVHVGDGRCEVLTVERVKNERAARRWFKRMLVEQPWETRN